jgi:tRNA(Ile)-lysidine synthase TilS/MesJ
MSALKQQD